MRFKRKIELELVKIRKQQLSIMESLLRLSQQDVETLRLIEALINESKDKKTKRSR